MRVIVAGSRTFNDYDKLAATLDELFAGRIDTLTIVSGRARGADQLGESYALRRRIPIASYPADWDTYGKRAGYLRNVQMAENADVLVAFWDGHSRGTEHMIDVARARGLMVKVVYPEGVG